MSMYSLSISLVQDVYVNIVYHSCSRCPCKHCLSVLTSLLLKTRSEWTFPHNKLRKKLIIIPIRKYQNTTTIKHHPMTKYIRIGLAGRVSSGKSSFTNALSGGFISNTSLLRETFKPLYYQFGPNGKEELIQRLGDQLENDRTPDNVREKIKETKEDEIASIKRQCDDDNELPLRYGINPFSITDMAGIDDADDNDDKFFRVFESMYTNFDLIIYMTDATQAFRDKSEVDTFLKIQKMINQWNQTGEYIELIVIINKYDDDDEDLEKIYNKVISNKYIDEQKIFRVSSHKLMIDNVKQHALHLYVPNMQTTKEFTKILKNTGESPIKNLKPKTHVTLCYSEDVVNDSDSGDRHEKKKHIDGDVDNLIPYLRTANQTLADKSLESHHDHNKNILDACLRLYGVGLHKYTKPLQNVQTVMNIKV